MQQEKKSQSTKTLILDAAYQMINQIGYKKTTLRAISKETNLSMGAITHHFKTKGDIVYRVTMQSTKNFYNEITHLLKHYDLDLIEHDAAYVGCWLTVFLTSERCLNFYYDLVQDNVLTRCLAERTYMNYLRKANHLNLDLGNSELYAYALTSIGTLTEFVRGLKERHLRLPVHKLITIYNTQLLENLRLTESQITAVLKKTEAIYRSLSFDATDIFDIRLYLNDK